MNQQNTTDETTPIPSMTLGEKIRQVRKSQYLEISEVIETFKNILLKIETLKNILLKNGFCAMTRKKRGNDINAACGQLSSKKNLSGDQP